MKTTRFGILLLVLFITTQVRAEWKQIAEGTDRALYVDTSSVQSNGRTKTVWTLIDHTVIQREAGDSYISSKGLWELNCGERMARQVSHSIHSGQMGRGSTVWSGALNRDFQHVSSSSFGGAIINEVCR